MQSINLDRRKALKKFNQFALLSFGGFILYKEKFLTNSFQNDIFFNGIKLSPLENLKAYVNLNVNLAYVCKESFVYKDYEVIKKYFSNPSLYYNTKTFLSKEFKVENKSLMITAPKDFINSLIKLIQYDKNSKTLTQFIYDERFVAQALDC